MTLDDLNCLPDAEARGALLSCCGSRAWVDGMINRRPFTALSRLLADEAEISDTLAAADWREAFAAHPRIGDLAALQKKFATTAAWAREEQAAATAATETTLRALERGNQEYERRFGFTFIICATGKSAAELLSALEARLRSDPATELRTAAGEQQAITRLRLKKLVTP